MSKRFDKKLAIIKLKAENLGADFFWWMEKTHYHKTGDDVAQPQKKDKKNP